MRSFDITADARSDLESLYEYGIGRFGERAADLYVRRLLDRIEQLCSQPWLGRSRPEFGADYRSIVLDRYVVLYRVTQTDIKIIRIVHGSYQLAPADVS